MCVSYVQISKTKRFDHLQIHSSSFLSIANQSINQSAGFEASTTKLKRIKKVQKVSSETFLLPRLILSQNVQKKNVQLTRVARWFIFKRKTLNWVNFEGP
jgi:hypothetical protein